MFWLLALLSAVAAAGALVLRRGSGGVAGITYAPRADWGPSWGRTRPPDLPAGARRPSHLGAALPAVRAIAAQVIPGDLHFVRAMEALARNESRGTWGLPANRPHPAAAGWGVYQYNTSAWRSLGATYYGHRVSGLPAHPWDATPEQEIRWPVERYGAVWRYVRAHGGSPRAAVWAVRMWHRAPGVARRIIDRHDWSAIDRIPDDVTGWIRDAWRRSIHDAEGYPA